MRSCGTWQQFENVLWKGGEDSSRKSIVDAYFSIREECIGGLDRLTKTKQKYS
jgi:hypothetical protein